MKKHHLLFVATFFILQVLNIQSQDTIYLQNPSFEDMPRKGGEFSRPISGWLDCGSSLFPSESPPDIHSAVMKIWEVDSEPADGKTYLGLVVRYNDTYESLTQRLSTPLFAGQCYDWNAYLAFSSVYKSATRRSGNEFENFSHPVVFQVWGGNAFCEKITLLAETAPVNHITWKLYKMVLFPEQDFDYITIQAYYSKPINLPYNGHILVDGLSPIIPIQCE